ncbi:MAG TPA: inositol monophosphatase [Stellaceae bacterium]|jgi:fructose-1,6-bisphosphatase/inositol monophosphatase family enzyme
MIDTESVATFMRETARAVILPRFRALRQGDVREKRPGDPVTIADTEAEQELTRRLKTVLHGANVLGEESVAEDASRLAWLSAEAPVWIIDPIDGTSNFVRGNAGFVVIVALARQGIVEGGWIYNPLGDVMISALKGEGAWSAGRRLQVNREVPPEKLTGAAYGRTKSGVRAGRALNDSGRIRGVHNQGCSGLEYMAIAQGMAQFSLHSRSLPWDHAAGMLIVHEAGGVGSFLDGGVYDPRIIDQAVLAASTPQGWQTVHDVVTAA